MSEKVILGIAAHPDDLEFSCGGSMIKFREQGYKIYFAVATNGENGFKLAHKSKKNRIKIRYNEQIKAAKILDVEKVFFLNYKDGLLSNTDGLRKKLAAIIKKVKPDIIMTFDPANLTFESVNVNHRDHRVIGEASFDAVFMARNRYMLPGESHAVSYFWFFACDKPNHFENISKYIYGKIELIKEHRSQFYDFNDMEQWVKLHLSSFTKKYKYSEKFRIVEIQIPFRGRGKYVHSK